MKIIILLFCLFIQSCHSKDQNILNSEKVSYSDINDSDVLVQAAIKVKEDEILDQTKLENINKVNRHELVKFAQSLVGIPYKYASTDPEIGFDCSGFITYVFNHFHMTVPRSSFDFTNYGETIDRKAAKEGDLILFTETYEASTRVGHMGIITENKNDSLKFIHSTSGKAYGVTISDLTPHYEKRFVKVIRVLED